MAYKHSVLVCSTFSPFFFPLSSQEVDPPVTRVDSRLRLTFFFLVCYPADCFSSLLSSFFPHFGLRGRRCPDKPFTFFPPFPAPRLTIVKSKANKRWSHGLRSCSLFILLFFFSFFLWKGRSDFDQRYRWEKFRLLFFFPPSFSIFSSRGRKCDWRLARGWHLFFSFLFLCSGTLNRTADGNLPPVRAFLFCTHSPSDDLTYGNAGPPVPFLFLSDFLSFPLLSQVDSAKSFQSATPFSSQLPIDDGTWIAEVIPQPLLRFRQIPFFFFSFSQPGHPATRSIMKLPYVLFFPANALAMDDVPPPLSFFFPRPA